MTKEYHYRKHIYWGQYVILVTLVLLFLLMLVPIISSMRTTSFRSPAIFLAGLALLFLIEGMILWYLYHRMAGVVVSINERNARRHASPPGRISAAVPNPAAPKPRVEVNHETIQGSDLQSAPFIRCCDGNADLFPFKCFICGHIMVFCYECDTLYPELQDTGIMQLHIGHVECPRCHYRFDEGFMKYPGYYVTPAEWKQAGYEMLLTESGRKKLPPG